MIKRYGVEYPCQDPVIFSKMLRSCYRKKLYTFPSGRIEYVQGYEPQCIDYLLTVHSEDDLVISCEEIPPIWYNNPVREGKTSRYYPDAYIVSENTMIEVKSPYTYKKDLARNLAKFSTVAKLGFTLHLYVYNEKELLYKHLYKPNGTVIYSPPNPAEIVFID